MRKLTEPTRVVARNAWGGYSTTFHQEFEVEADDAGATRLHYLGHNHRSYAFTRADAGRVIVQMTDGKGWSCWSFKSGGT
jgi:hypothetical protein